MDTLERWHDYVRDNDPAALQALLSDDVVFQSPAVHTPQVGRELTTRYLRAAMVVLNNDSFRYLGEWRAERSVVLEFACELQGIQVNGVDIITWNEAGLITGFKVMVRPLKALNTLLPLMAAALQG